MSWKNETTSKQKCRSMRTFTISRHLCHNPFPFALNNVVCILGPPYVGHCTWCQLQKAQRAAYLLMWQLLNTLMHKKLLTEKWETEVNVYPDSVFGKWHFMLSFLKDIFLSGSYIWICGVIGVKIHHICCSLQDIPKPHCVLFYEISWMQ